MRSKGHVYVVAESMYSDRPRIPMNPSRSPGLTNMPSSQHPYDSVQLRGPWDGSLTQEGAPCIRVDAPRREYVFWEPRKRGCVLFPITGRAQEDVAPDVFGRSTYVGADHQLNRMNSP